MAVQSATTVWEGRFEGGKGLMILGCGHFDEPFCFSSRFGDGKGTSPEELLGAACTGSFSMALAQELSLAGFEPVRIVTSSKVKISSFEEEYAITSLYLKVDAKVPGIEKREFLDSVHRSKNKCLVLKKLSGLDIFVQALLEN